MIGVTMFPAFLKGGENSTVDDYVDAIRARDRGRRRGTRSPSAPISPRATARSFFDWITNDKGDARSLIKFTPLSNPKGRGDHRAAP